MNTASWQAKASSSSRAESGKVLLVILALTSLLVWSVGDCFWMDGDGQALRKAMVTSSGATFHRQFQAAVGPVLLGATRFGLSFVADLPPEARRVIGAVKSARVSVSRVEGTVGRTDFSKMLQATDRVMNRRGWERIVGVLDGDALVVIYVDPSPGWGGTVKIRLGVLESEQLVIVSTKAKLKPVVEVAIQAMQDELGKGR